MDVDAHGNVSGHRPDIVNRLDRVGEAIQALHSVLAIEESFQDMLARVAHSAVGAVADADAVSITLLGKGSSCTVAHTEDRVLALDAQQYSAGSGPCLEAARSRRPVRMVIEAHEQRWPEFVAAARADGVQATLSVPLILATANAGDEDALVGSLNTYSRRASYFDAVDEKLLSLYTNTAAQAIAALRRWKRLADNIAQLQQALVSRADIDQAKGALRVLHGGSADDAFAELVDRSQRENVKVRDLARQVIDDLSRPVPPS